MEEDYSKNQKLKELARSLKAAKILSAQVIERNGCAYVELTLNDGRQIEIGTCGSLHDEAYLIFGIK